MKHKPRPTPTKRSTSFSLQSTASAGKFKLLGTTSGYLGATQRYYCTVYDYKDRDAAGDWHGLHAWAAEADETGDADPEGAECPEDVESDRSDARDVGGEFGGNM